MGKRITSIPVLAATVNGYADLWKCRSAVAAYTIASLAELGLVNVSDKGLATKGKGRYHAPLLRALCKASMVNHWTKIGRLDDNGLTVAGLNEVTERLSNPKYSYRTSLEAVNAMRKGLTTGQPVELEGNTFGLGKVVKTEGGLFA